MAKWCTSIYFSAVKPSIPCSKFFYTFHGHLSWFWLDETNMTFCTAISVFATLLQPSAECHKHCKTSYLKNILLPFPSPSWFSILGFPDQLLMVEACSFMKLPLCPTEQGWWSSLWDLRRKKRKACTTTCGWRERWEGKKQFCRHPGTGPGAEIHLQPMEDPPVEPDI